MENALFARIQAEPPPIATLIGFSPVELGQGRAIFELEVDPTRHANPMGTLHGGRLTATGRVVQGVDARSAWWSATWLTKTAVWWRAPAAPA